MIEKDKIESSKSIDLHRHAEELVRKKPEEIPDAPTENIHSAIQKLQVCQIELEMKNEELNKVQSEKDTSRIKVSLTDITESHKAEEKSLFMDPITEHVSDSIIVTDTDYKITHVNRATEILYGYSREELIGQSPDIFNAEPLSDEIQEDIYRTVAGGKEWSGSHLNKRKDGSTFICELKVSPLNDRTGRVHSYIGLQRDITKHRRMENALKQSEKKFRLLYENAPVAYQSLDMNGNLLEINKAWLDLLGYSRKGEIVGRGFRDFLAPDQLERFEEQFVLFRKSGNVHGVEFKIVKKDGSVVSVSVNGKVAYDESGEFKQTHCILYDITERKIAEDEAKFAHSELQQIFSAAAPLLVIDKDYNMIRYNDTYSALFRLNKEEHVGKKCYVEWKGPMCDSHKCPMKQIRAGREHCDYETDVDLKDGSRISCIVSATPYRGTDGEFLGIVENFTDITERKRAEKELRNHYLRIQRQQAAIVKLATNSSLLEGDFTEAMRITTEVAAETLEVTRIGIWLLTEDRKQLRCIDLFDKSSNMHSEGTIFRTGDYPRYLEAIEAMRAIDAYDARTDPRTCEFTDVYLVPLGISSLLNAGIRLRGKVVGLVDIEHIGAKRTWTTDEIAFAGEVSDQIAQVLLAHERKKAKETLRESEKKYRRLVETMNDGLIVSDENGIVTYANDRFCEMLGYSCSEVVGHHEADFYDEANRKILDEEVTKRRRGIIDPYEIECTAKSGQKLTVIVSPRPIFGNRGRYEGSLAIITDITERKRAEEALIAAHEQLNVKHLALTEKNIALKEVLNHIEREKKEARIQVAKTVDQVLMPALNRLKRSDGTVNESYFDLVQKGLEELTSESGGLLKLFSKLSPREVEICNMIKNGYTSQEIADALCISLATVKKHREKVRKKLGLISQNINLASYLKNCKDV